MSIELKTPVSDKPVLIGYGSGYDNIIMAIESSCDETACAVVKNGREVLANVVASQIKTHREFGGVVPEVAAREHLEAINLVIKEGFEQAGVKPQEVTAFASTVGPGLVGSLLVGLNAAKTLAVTYDKPFVGINHLSAHICANYINTDLEPPFLALLVSGGHTQIIMVKDYNDTKIIGETLDDATGEAYDKVARLLGLPYPGGVYLDKIAPNGDKNAYKLPIARVDGYNFSFSGLKTAVLNLTKKLEKEQGCIPKEDVAASFQECITKTLFDKVYKATQEYNIKQVVLAGGVAANSEIRKKFFALKEQGYKVFAPEMKYCTDNASMVGACAYFSPSCELSKLDIEVFSRCK